MRSEFLFFKADILYVRDIYIRLFFLYSGHIMPNGKPDLKFNFTSMLYVISECL